MPRRNCCGVPFANQFSNYFRTCLWSSPVYLVLLLRGDRIIYDMILPLFPAFSCRLGLGEFFTALYHSRDQRMKGSSNACLEPMSRTPIQRALSSRLRSPPIAGRPWLKSFSHACTAIIWCRYYSRFCRFVFPSLAWSQPTYDIGSHAGV